MSHCASSRLILCVHEQDGFLGCSTFVERGNLYSPQGDVFSWVLSPSAHDAGILESRRASSLHSRGWREVLGVAHLPPPGVPPPGCLPAPLPPFLSRKSRPPGNKGNPGLARGGVLLCLLLAGKQHGDRVRVHFGLVFKIQFPLLQRETSLGSHLPRPQTREWL